MYRQIENSDHAVSPVVGVILMVSATLVISAICIALILFGGGALFGNLLAEGPVKDFLALWGLVTIVVSLLREAPGLVRELLRLVRGEPQPEDNVDLEDAWVSEVYAQLSRAEAGDVQVYDARELSGEYVVDSVTESRSGYSIDLSDPEENGGSRVVANHDERICEIFSEEGVQETVWAVEPVE